jgi:hypothetical protein
MIVRRNQACCTNFGACRWDHNSKRCGNRDAITDRPVDAVDGFPVELRSTPSMLFGTTMAMG